MDREGVESEPISLIESNRQLARILEGLLFAAGHEGLTTAQIASILDLAPRQAEALCELLARIQETEQRAFRVCLIGGTWQLLTDPDLSPFLKKMATAPSLPNLSQAALETLAIVAIRQPVTRVDIDNIRGVKSDHPLGTLLTRGLITEMGRAEGPGRPILYGTSQAFMDYFGLKSLQDLQLPTQLLGIE